MLQFVLSGAVISVTSHCAEEVAAIATLVYALCSCRAGACYFPFDVRANMGLNIIARRFIFVTCFLVLPSICTFIVHADVILSRILAATWDKCQFRVEL